jgi:hypothetical protein
VFYITEFIINQSEHEMNSPTDKHIPEKNEKIPELTNKRPNSFDEKKFFSLSNLKARTLKSNQRNSSPKNKLTLTSLNKLDRVTPKQIPPRKGKKLKFKK